MSAASLELIPWGRLKLDHILDNAIVCLDTKGMAIDESAPGMIITEHDYRRCNGAGTK